MYNGFLPVMAAVAKLGELRDLLGRCYEVFDRVAHPSPRVTSEWRCYKKGTPPVLKVIDGKRTLYHVRPDRNSAHVTLVLGRLACDAAGAGVSIVDLPNRSVRRWIYVDVGSNLTFATLVGDSLLIAADESGWLHWIRAER